MRRVMWSDHDFLSPLPDGDLCAITIAFSGADERNCIFDGDGGSHQPPIQTPTSVTSLHFRVLQIVAVKTTGEASAILK